MEDLRKIFLNFVVEDFVLVLAMELSENWKMSIYVTVLIVIVLAVCFVFDYYEGTGIFRTTQELQEPECTDDISVFHIEPGTTYLCFKYQECFVYTLPNGTVEMRVENKCEEG